MLCFNICSYTNGILNIYKYVDLLNLFPNRYIDRTKYHKIRELQPNSSEIQVIGTVVNVQEVSQKHGKRLVATFQDETGGMELVWFRGIKWIKENLKRNTLYVIFTMYYRLEIIIDFSITIIKVVIHMIQRQCSTNTF